MDVSGQETDWRSAAFRQKLVSQIEDAMRKAGVAHSKSSKDMESHVFLKAKTRDEYLSLVKGNGYFQNKRNEQAKFWMYETINEQLRKNFYQNEKKTPVASSLPKARPRNVIRSAADCPAMARA